MKEWKVASWDYADLMYLFHIRLQKMHYPEIIKQTSMKQGAVHPPVCINDAELEIVECFKFLGVYINNNLAWYNHSDATPKKADQCVFHRRQRKISVPPLAHTNFCNVL